MTPALIYALAVLFGGLAGAIGGGVALWLAPHVRRLSAHNGARLLARYREQELV